MRVVRGRAENPEADQERTRALADEVAETGEPALRVWTPHRQVAFGRRDRRSDGYERAKRVARERGYVVTERAVGGRAVAFTGDTVAFALVEPVEGHRTGIHGRYERILDAVQAALAACGVQIEPGEPRNSFCPGSHSLQVDDGKVVGIAQRVRQEVAVVAGLVVVDSDEVVAVLEPVYGALGVPFDPSSVGTIPPTNGFADDLRDAIEGAFADGHRTDATQVRET